MKKLIITAHPSQNGFTHKIAQRYKKASEKKNDVIEILDLYKTDLKQDYLFFENRKEIQPTPQTKEIQKKITWADEIVFIFPIWWSDSPAILKNFIDVNFSTGFAYKYESGKIKGLLEGRTTKVFMTCDSLDVYYKFPFINLKLLWKTGRLGNCGLKTKYFMIFDKMRKRDEKEREKLLQKVEKAALI